jgi:hypothetical protein
MFDRLADRLIAALIGLLCGLVMALIWSVVVMRGLGACLDPRPGAVNLTVCFSIKAVYWFLLAGLPLIGFIFGFDALLKFLSKMWGTDKP